MSDWQVGDLAVCVDARPNPVWGPSRLKEGRAYDVIGVIYNPGPSTLYGREDYGLFLAGIDSGTREGFASQRFRKIRPDEHESCEPEFVTLLKRGKAPSPAERETRILEALFPPKGGRAAQQAPASDK